MSTAALDDLLAKSEIRYRLATYCRAIDRFDVGLFDSVWHPDSTLDYGGGRMRGSVVGLGDVYNENHSNWAVHSHGITSSSIFVRGDRAVSETTTTAVLRAQPDDTGLFADTNFEGRYLDRWSRRNGRWAIDDRLAARGFAWTHSVAGGLGADSRRGPEDPSYQVIDRSSGDGARSLDDLAAEQEIRSQLSRLALGVDTGDLAMVTSVWHPDGGLESTNAAGQRERGTTAADAAALTLAAVDGSTDHVYQLANCLIEITGDHATSETYLITVDRIRSGDGEFRDVHRRGRALDRWSRRDGAWAVDHRVVVDDFWWDQPRSA